MEHLDGNAAAALLEEAFGRDVTATRATCAGCGAVEALATAHTYMGGPGTVLRCCHCTAVLVRVAWTRRLELDTAGVAQLH